MNAPGHLMIMASAGSGKTYALTTRFGPTTDDDDRGLIVTRTGRRFFERMDFGPGKKTAIGPTRDSRGRESRLPAHRRTRPG